MRVSSKGWFSLLEMGLAFSICVFTCGYLFNALLSLSNQKTDQQPRKPSLDMGSPLPYTFTEENDEHHNEADYYEPISNSENPDEQPIPDSDNSQEPINYFENPEEPITENGNSPRPSNGLSNSDCSRARTVLYEDIEIHVFGGLQGLEGLQTMDGNDNHTDYYEEDDEEEERRREEAETAIRDAEIADLERRNAPLEAQTMSVIMDVMRNISLSSDVTPSWAHSIPDDQFINQVRRLTSPSSSQPGTRRV